MHSTRHFIVEQQGQHLVWAANNRVIDADHVREVVDQYVHRPERALRIYSGVHGDMAGNFSRHPERTFAYEDRHGLPSNVLVINVSRNAIDVAETIAGASTDVLFAWCFSNVSITRDSSGK